ncbi:MAG TPA: type II toxin-antitoxin system RelE/ParE family toxin [Rhodopila sp.]|nr:type II toxin-antitoxin system RelE/ParE family toxin [Rhodopila sp.]
MLEIRFYVEDHGICPFEQWFERLDPAAAAKVTTGIARMEQGNVSNTKSVGDGVLECRIDRGPGYRVYFGLDGDVLVILPTGETKRRQHNDILRAKEFWHDYKARRRKETKGSPKGLH